MKNLILPILLTITFCYSCNNDDDNAKTTYKEFLLEEVNNSGVKGIVQVIKSPSGNSFISISLEGTNSGNTYSTNIYNNSLSEGGDIAFSLSNINGEDNKTVISSTSLNSMYFHDPELDITYDQLLNFNGHIKVLNNKSDSTILAQGNIGVNIQ